MSRERGYGRLALGLVTVIGVAGTADHTPLTLGMVPCALLGMALGAWGLHRNQYGPSLPRLKARLQPQRARRAHLLVRAGGRA